MQNQISIQEIESMIIKSASNRTAHKLNSDSDFMNRVFNLRYEGHYHESSDMYSAIRIAARHELAIDGVISHVSDKLEVGAILYSSWGYEQTNIDFYVVAKMTLKTVWLAKMSSEIESNSSFMSDNVVAGKVIAWEDGLMQRRFKTYGESISVSIESYSSAWLWDGRPKNKTSYA